MEGIASAGASGAGSGRMTVPSVFRGIHADGVASYRYRYPSTMVYQLLSTWVFPQRGAGAPGKEKTALDPRAEKWALRVLGFKGFARGLRPTVVSSFVGSAATISAFSLVFFCSCWARVLTSFGTNSDRRDCASLPRGQQRRWRSWLSGRRIEYVHYATPRIVD